MHTWTQGGGTVFSQAPVPGRSPLVTPADLPHLPHHGGPHLALFSLWLLPHPAGPSDPLCSPVPLPHVSAHAPLPRTVVSGHSIHRRVQRKPGPQCTPSGIREPILPGLEQPRPPGVHSHPLFQAMCPPPEPTSHALLEAGCHPPRLPPPLSFPASLLTAPPPSSPLSASSLQLAGLI